ncbi:hypothetical protein VNO78_02625 [Psophocarpus tetragonolobus]|uniref:Uncharacterized protein n=1 Tax=Psophocarpus tetragonolobus TaxID=3891 RepID=A0AAN9T2R8_PSOTE
MYGYPHHAWSRKLFEYVVCKWLEQEEIETDSNLEFGLQDRLKLVTDAMHSLNLGDVLEGEGQEVNDGPLMHFREGKRHFIQAIVRFNMRRHYVGMSCIMTAWRLLRKWVGNLHRRELSLAVQDEDMAWHTCTRTSKVLSQVICDEWALDSGQVENGQRQLWRA